MMKRFKLPSQDLKRRLLSHNIGFFMKFNFKIYSFKNVQKDACKNFKLTSDGHKRHKNCKNSIYCTGKHVSPTKQLDVSKVYSN